MKPCLDLQSSLKLSDRMLYMLDHQLMCDVTLNVGPTNTPIKCHKYMLASSSKVFYCMFNGPLAQTGVVSIPDIQPEIFKNLLRFVYSDEVELNTDNAQQLMYASDKYMLDNLKEKCIKFLKSHLDCNNVIEILEASLLFSLEDVKKKCLEFIAYSNNGCTVFQTDKFSSLPESVIKLILDFSAFSCKEEFIYEGLIQWSKKQCLAERKKASDKNMRLKLKNFIKLVRFPLMDEDYFVRQISTREILTKDEIVQIYQSFHGIKTSGSNFSFEPRCSKAVEFMRCKIKDGLSMWDMSSEENIDFKVNCDSLLTAVKYFGSMWFSERKVEIIISKIDLCSKLEVSSMEQRVLSDTHKPNINQDKNVIVYDFPLLDPLKIEKNTVYRMKMVMTRDTFRGYDYHPVVTNGDVTVIFMNSESTAGKTNVNQGQFPGITLRKL